MPQKLSVIQKFAVGLFTAALIACGFVAPSAPANAYPLSSMGLEFVTTGANEVAQIGFSGTLTNVTIDWGDGTSLENISGGVNIPEAAYSHTYASPGTYVAVVSATTLSHFGYCGNPTNNWNLKRILSWGTMNTTDFKCAAFSRTALTSVPSTLPAGVTNLNAMFYDAHVFNQDLSGWDTSNVVNMERTFQSAPSFNQSLASWDMSSVTGALGILTNTIDLSDANYSSTLVGWASQSLQPSINLDAIPAQAVGCPAITARDALRSAPLTWTIGDESPTQVCTAQTVSWTPSNTSPAGARTMTPNTIAVGSDLGAITYSVSNTGTTGCTVNSSTGQISALAAGTCIVRATAAATPAFFAGSTTVSFIFTDAVVASSTLANTGSSVMWGIILGATLFLAGVIAIGLVVVYRRRSAAQSAQQPVDHPAK